MAKYAFDLMFVVDAAFESKARRFCQFVRLGKRGGSLAHGLIGSAAVLYFTISLLIGEFAHHFDDAGALIAPLVWVLVIAFAVWNALVRRSRNQFPHGGTVRAQLDLERVRLSHDGGAMEWPWSQIMGFEVSPEVFLLLTSNGYIAIPARAVAVEDVEDFTLLLYNETLIRNPTYGFPVVTEREASEAAGEGAKPPEITRGE